MKHVVFEPSMDVSQHLWPLAIKVIGAVCGSAISIVYMLPASKRESAARFLVGVLMGLMFGKAAGLELAKFLSIQQDMSTTEIVMSGSALASLASWWALGALRRLFNTYKSHNL